MEGFFLVSIITNIVCLFYACGDKRRFLKEIMHFHYNDLYGHTLAQEPLTWGLEIYNFGKPFRGHHYYILSFSDLCLGVEKNIF